MKYDLKRPCANCPFRKGPDTVRLRKGRVKEIMRSEGTFPCHKTLVRNPDPDDDDDAPVAGPNSQACMGSIIFQIKIGRPNQMTRIAGRMGLLKPEVVESPANIAAVVDSAREIEQ